MFDSERILVVAAHADDEVLGAGATIAKLVKEGHEVYVLLLSVGGLARKGTDQTLVKEVQKNVLEVQELLGVTTYWRDYPDQQFDTLPLITLIQDIEETIESLKIGCVITHSYSDLNQDHKITHKAVLTACRPGCSTIKELYCYEVLSSTEWSIDTFKPRLFIDITNELAIKIQACMLYSSEMRSYPHPRSEEAIRNLAKVRGSQAGVEAAEAFEVVRIIRGNE